ncbi:MAG TPA: DUF402 domain-containing protein [Gaiellaceae bacterium]
MRYVGKSGAGHLLYVRPGDEMRRRGTWSEWDRDAVPELHVWDRTHLLWLVREGGDLHALGHFWDTNWSFLGWYVNLQAPLVVRGNRFDTTDWALDVWIEPDGSWEWKDEDHFAAAVNRGFLDEATAGEIRAEGERVIAERPWPTGWEDWRAPAEWAPLELPEDWHVV